MNPIAAIKTILHENSFFFYLLATLLVAGASPFFIFEKEAFFIFLKQWHHPLADCMVPYFTWLGDGLVYLLLLPLIGLFPTSCINLLVIGGGFLTMSIVVQLLKRVFFSHVPRPMALLAGHKSLHLVDGVDLLTDLSFPSGHAATIFLLVSFLQFLPKRKSNLYTLILIALSIIVAYSRIYLCQHFYTDIYAGAWIGVLSALAIYAFFLCINRLAWFDRSIYFLLRKNGKWLPFKKK